ncbi:hypothetical protein BWQ96_09264 [Gracilariopsis chorda]|uniref:Uncharacterized protein n=1 Tax=Gracilariopsis chorda TaxID=448386 RepID=A0A2V3IG18_9FLOR|nr:hypothetical protein BWQ96_09264 [Gracilariopsis chorda]|eukprot:PXF41024.1 hypothetical protein BWQ96_09264 [Gracilariopsis chorda]
MICWDGLVRRVYVFVVFVVADWPAATKLGGFVGHQGKRCCRYCSRERTSGAPMPCGGRRSRRRAIRMDEYYGWINLEYPNLLTNDSIRNVWENLRIAHNKSDCGSSLRIMRTTGIKRKPLIARVISDFGQAFPYDTMHLCFSELVSMMIRLTFVMHENL